MIRWIDGLTKEYHHVKVAKGDDTTGYEPAMVIMDHRHQGKSFIITLGAMYKYLDPMMNRDELLLGNDREDFEELKEAALLRKRLAVSWMEQNRAAADLACCLVAEAFSKGMKMLLCTAWNLAKCMQMFNIPVSPQSAAQLLMWIQDGLDDLKNMPPAPLPEDTFIAGEMTLYNGSEKIAEKPMIMTESEVIAEERDAGIAVPGPARGVA